VALGDNAIDRGRIWFDDNYDPPVLKRWDGSAWEIATPLFSAYTDEDSNTDTMLKAHAYLAATSGFVTAYSALGAGRNLKGYVGATNDPAGAGDLVQSIVSQEDTNTVSISFPVAAGKYFEITGDGTPVIRWVSVGALSKPVDQD
jgi:hypothetical protein